MKIDDHAISRERTAKMSQKVHDRFKKNSSSILRCILRLASGVLVANGMLFLAAGSKATAQSAPALNQIAPGPPVSPGLPSVAVPDATDNAEARRDAAGRELVARVIQQIARGGAFDAKFRQRTWVGGREVVGVGTYEQAGRGSGQYNLQLTMHDGDGRHSLQQVSDGRLAWTRQQIGGVISLRRVDVGRLDQWVEDASREPTFRSTLAHTADSHELNSETRLAPSLKVGAWTELLDKIATDHDFTLVAGTLDAREVWIVTGTIRETLRQEQIILFGQGKWPELVPTRVVIAIARTNDLETKFGQGLPLRIEFWTDPVIESGQSVTNDQRISSARPRLVSLLEIYSIRPISPPPVERFRFDNQDAEVNFINETDRYLSGYGVRLTERQQRELSR